MSVGEAEESGERGRWWYPRPSGPRWWLVSRISWVALSLRSHEADTSSHQPSIRGDVSLSCVLSSLSSLPGWTWHRLPVWIQYTHTVLYSDTGARVQSHARRWTCPPVCMASHWFHSYHEYISLGNKSGFVNTSQQELSQTEYNISIADLTNNTLKIMFLKR